MVCGNLIGGISRKNSALSPGITLDARNPARSTVANTLPAHINVALPEIGASIPRITPSCAEQGTARARRKVVIILSLLVSRILVVIVAIVSHPRPSTIGKTALPFRPITLNILLAMIASLGKYPESSSIAKAIKNVVVIGSIIPIA